MRKTESAQPKKILRAENRRFFRALSDLTFFVLILSSIAPAQVPVPQPDADQEGVPVRERRQVQRFEQAKQLLIPGDSNIKPDSQQAIRLLQAILDDGLDGEAGLGSEDVFWEESIDRSSPDASLKSETRRLLNSLSGEARLNYEIRFGKAAAARLEEAKSKGDWRSTEEIARRWPASIAGTEAIWMLAQRAFDQGQLLEAAGRFEELRSNSTARTAYEPGLSLRLALAWRLSGRVDHCRRVLGELKASHESRPILRVQGGELAWFGQESEAVSWLDRWAGASLKPLRTTVENPRDWRMAFGGPTRNRFAAGAVPTERPVWSHGLFASDELDNTSSQANSPKSVPVNQRDRAMRILLASAQVELRASIEQRLQAGRPVLPAAQPLVVGDVVIVRTLTQLQAFRLTDGRLLWSSAAIDSQVAEHLAETLLARTPRTMRSDWQTLIQQRSWDDFSSANLSSDGELVFSLHDRGHAAVMRPQIAWRGMFLPQESNTLVAIEANSGRMAWEVGGPHGEDGNSNSGGFFLGPPLSWNGELFAITDDGMDVRLVAMSPRDGKLLWMQTLASSDPMWGSVTRDIGLSPSVAGGLLICPTGAGSIVAVDPLRRELRWQTTYREPAERLPRRRFDFHAPSLAAETWWQQSVPLVAGDKLLVASPDHGELLCLDVLTGDLHWKRPRGDALFLAGLADLPEMPRSDQRHSIVVIAGHNDLQAVHVSSGEIAWSLPANVGPLLGRGVLIDGVLHQPVSNNDGEVVSVELQTGRILARTEVPRLLGNLVAAHGQIVSQSATHVAAFPALRDLETSLTKSLTEETNNARALEERGRLRLHLGQRARGLEDLRHAVALGASADAKRTLAALLLEELRLDRKGDIEATIRELETLVDDPKQRLQFARLRAHGLQQRGESLSAARELLKLADAWEPTNELEPFGNGTARADRWTAARLRELRESLSGQDQKTLDDEVVQRARTATESTGTARIRHFLALFGWSNSGENARRTLFERLTAKRHRHDFEATLLAMRRDSAVDQQAFATAQLTRHWLSLGQHELVRPLLDELATRFADVRSLDQKSGHELAEQWQQEFREQLLVEWPKETLQVAKSAEPVPIERTFPIDWAAPLDAFHQNWTLTLESTRQRLIARDSLGREVWRFKLPLEEHAIIQANGNSAAWLGRWLIVNLGDQFLVLDTIPATESQESVPVVLWRAALFDRRIEMAVTPLPLQQPTPIDGTPTRYLMTDSSGRRLGRVAVLSEEVVCFQTGSRLIAAELSNGDPLWTFDGLPAGCDLSGDSHAVVAISPDRRELFTFDTLDGRLISRQDVASVTVLGSFGRNVLTRNVENDSVELRLQDAWLNRDLLRKKFTPNARPCLSLRDSLVVLDPVGQLSIWSLADGRPLLEQSLPPIPHLSHLVVLRDRERWTVLTQVDEPTNDPKRRPRVSELYFDHWKVHGPCFAFSRNNRKLLWSERIEQQSLNASQPADSPVLLLAARIAVPAEAGRGARETFRLQVELLDKRTGQHQKVFEDVALSMQSFCEQRPDIASKHVGLTIDRTRYDVKFE